MVDVVNVEFILMIINFCAIEKIWTEQLNDGQACDYVGVGMS